MWEFWKRWHMSLTRFFTDILYAPLTLAVNRWLFNSITSRNNRFYSAALAKCVEFGPILFIFVITGIWHGSGAQFVIFGLLNGIAVYVGIYYSRSVAYKKIYGPILIFSNLIVVSIIFVYFRANSLEQANTIVALIFGYKSSWLASSNGFESGLFDYRSVLAVIVGLIVIFFKSTIYDFLPSRVRPLYYRGSGSIRISARIGFPLAIGGGVIVALCLSKLLNGNFVDFIYFKF
jgi:D-alanyl-lipoteichoic acid acyltransferase DltB (MBOAT superfamily)